jgi:hypothetical protein
VNDTTREIGGTLGVAVVGSVFASIFGPQLRDSFTGLAVPADVAAQASESLGAALTMAAQAPPELSSQLMMAAKDAFVHGLSAGCFVAVAAVVVDHDRRVSIERAAEPHVEFTAICERYLLGG